MPRAKLRTTGLLSLLATALLALLVAHTRGPFAVEEPALKWLGSRSARGTWLALAHLFAVPAISIALVASFALGFARRASLRVTVYTAFGAAALLISDQVVKPLVQRTLDTELTFPSGHVTAVSATALAMWLALYPLLGTRARNITLVLGIAWILLMSMAVIGAQWHTPLDAIGSVLLSLGIVTVGAAFFEPAGSRKPFMVDARARIGERGGG